MPQILPKLPLSVAKPNHVIRRTFLLRNINGLHARPAALLVRRLAPFQCEVTVESGGAEADARNVLELLSLAAGYTTKLAFTATGKDAADALEAVRQLFDSNFSEAYQ